MLVMGGEQTARSGKYRMSIGKDAISRVWWVLRLKRHPGGCRMVWQKGPGSKDKALFLL